MNKLFITTIAIGCMLILVGIALLGSTSDMFDSQKFEISNTQIVYATYPLFNYQLISSPESYFNFEIRNLHDSDLRTVGFSINNVNMGQYNLRTQPGQTTNEALPIENMDVSSFTTYNIELTFTFADGKFETYTTKYTTPEYKGEIEITKLSYIWVHPKPVYQGSFQIEIKNTGNIPISNIDCTFDDSKLYFFLPPQVNPGETSMSGKSFTSIYYPESDGLSYPVVIELEYLDGSTSTIRTSVVGEVN